MADDTRFLPMVARRALAVREQTALAASTVALFKAPFNPDETNVLADYIAQECDYDNYARIDLTTWPNLIAAAGNNYLIFAQLCVWVWENTGPGVQNQVGGMFVLYSDGTLGPVVVFGDSISMSNPDQSVVKTPAELVSSGSVG